MKIDSILLCAGQSSRMGADKALLDVGDGKTIDLVLQKLRAFSDRVIVVLGDNYQGVSDYLADRYADFVFPVFNAEHLQGGMLSSVKKGFVKVQSGHMAMLNLVDQPFVLPESYQKISDAYVEPAPFVIPVGRKDGRPKKGHPILFAADFVPKVLADSRAQTFRDVLMPYYQDAIYVDVLDVGITENLNTQKLFAAAKKRVESHEK